ncbi:MAG TPA: NAD(P)-dependent oxidoreductase, partial [bacterium]|nr:NAD(P)-dependent oxidoreductase [bacterium]
MAKIYYESDADLNVLKNKTIGIIGYGSQGRAHALNLKDSGLNVIISELKGTNNWALAENDGFKPLSTAELAQQADVMMMLAQDNIQPFVYKNEIEPNLKKQHAL